MTQVIKPPEPFGDQRGKITIFLSGPASHLAWRRMVEEEFIKDEKVVVFNPYLKSWDASWVERIVNPKFKDQVDWELEGLGLCDLILMYFDPNAEAPITLLELGLFAKEHKLIVCCPDGFWKKGYVEAVCAMHDVPLFDDLKEAIKVVKLYVKDLAGE